MSDNAPVSFRLTTRQFPASGAKAIQRVFDFTGGVLTVQGDFFTEMENGIFDLLQSVKIDNSQNAFPFSITFRGLGIVGDTVICPAFSVMTSQVLQMAEATPQFLAASAGGVKVPVTFLNVELPYFTYSTAPVQSSVITGTATNYSAAVTGADQIAIPANSKRLRAVIQNPSANVNSMWVQFAAPATADWNSQEILPGQQFDTSEGPLILGDIHLIGTAADHFYASEIHS